MLLHEPKNVGGVFARLVDIELEAELIMQAGVGRPTGDLILGGHEPGHDLAHAGGVDRQPALVAIFARQVDQDGLRVAQDHAAVFEYRDLAEGVLVDEGASFVRATHEIDGLKVKGASKQRTE